MNKIKYELVTHRVHGGMLAIFVKCSQYGSVIALAGIESKYILAVLVSLISTDSPT